MNNTAKLLLTVGACVAVGAALGILYAPDEGAETRKKIIKRTKRLTDSVSDGINDSKESLEEIKEILRKELHKVNRKIEEFKF